MTQLYQIGDQIKLDMVVREIKRGGMGIVYIVEHAKHSNLRLAYKSISTVAKFSESMLDALKRESLVWIALPPHPHVIKATSFEIESAPLLGLEYAAGGSLRDKMTARPIDLHTIIEVATQFCSAMAFLCDNFKIVHRDIKPENILFDKDDVLKVTDFGLSTVFAQQIDADLRERSAVDLRTMRTESEAGIVAGTLPYMSPEHFVKFEDADTTSDIYSFGVLLFEMCTGRLPFTGSTAEMFKRAHLSSPAPRAHDVSTAVPVPLSQAIGKCLQKDPAKRFSSFEEVFYTIAEIGEGILGRQSQRTLLTLDETEARLDAGDWNNRGYSLRQLGRTDEAVRCYDRGIALCEAQAGQPREVTFLQVAGVDREPLDSAIAMHAMLYENKAAAYLQSGKSEHWELAKEALAGALRVNKDSAFARFRLAEIATAEGDTDKGLSLLQEAVRLEPGNNDLLGKLMKMAFTAGRQDVFEPAFEEFIDLATQRGQTNLLVAFGCQYDEFEGGAEVALRFFDRALKLNPNSVPALFNFGVTLQRFGERGLAEQCYNGVISLEPQHALAYFHRAIVRAWLGDLAGMFNDLEGCAQHASPGLLLDKATMLLGLGPLAMDTIKSLPEQKLLTHFM